MDWACVVSWIVSALLAAENTSQCYMTCATPTCTCAVTYQPLSTRSLQLRKINKNLLNTRSCTTMVCSCHCGQFQVACGQFRSHLIKGEESKGREIRCITSDCAREQVNHKSTRVVYARERERVLPYLSRSIESAACVCLQPLCPAPSMSFYQPFMTEWVRDLILLAHPAS